MINIILFRPEKPQNTGNIMRTCSAIHAKLHIIGPISFSLDEKDLKRAGMDYIDTNLYRVYKDLDEFKKYFDLDNIFYISRYGKKVYSEQSFEKYFKDINIMFGRESTGIPHEILRDHMDKVLRIPMVPEARSLNLSNCVAIVSYEILRQQQFNDLATSEVIKGEDFLFEEDKT
jgi:tRNA (cytidine/uridine-2'-O-)-methyltransferase